VIEEVQRRLDSNPNAMRRRRETVEHPFGTIKARMGATHFLMKRLRNVAAEMALHVLAYNLTRVIDCSYPSHLKAGRRPKSTPRVAITTSAGYIDDPTRKHRRLATIVDHGRL
jgi:hypothetical protein